MPHVLRVEWEVLKHEVLTSHHLLRQSPRDNVEGVWLGLPNHYRQVPGGEKRLVDSLSSCDFKELVQSIERGFFNPLNQSALLVRACINENEICKPPSKISRMKVQSIGKCIFPPGALMD